MQIDREIILAANYMDIKAFLDVGCKTVANMIKGEPPHKIHKTSAQGRKVGQTPQNDDADSRKATTGIEEWDAQHVLVNLYELPIPLLLDFGCKTVANMIKGKLPEEIRKTCNIQNDFTPEEDQIRRGKERVDSRLEERNLLTKKTAGAGVSATLPTRRRGVTSFKKRPGSRDVPVVSLMSDLAIVDAFPCRVLRKSVAPELHGFGSGSFAVSLGPSDLSTLLALALLRLSTSNYPFRATYSQKLLSMALVKPDDELVIKPEVVAPNVNYADCAAGDVDLAMMVALPCRVFILGGTDQKRLITAGGIPYQPVANSKSISTPIPQSANCGIRLGAKGSSVTITMPIPIARPGAAGVVDLTIWMRCHGERTSLMKED